MLRRVQSERQTLGMIILDEEWPRQVMLTYEDNTEDGNLVIVD